MNSTWQDGRPNYSSGEVRLHLLNTEVAYYVALDCDTPDELRERFEFYPPCRVDWNEVDWRWIHEQLEEDRAAERGE